MKITVVGSGNVAWGLSSALKRAGNPPARIIARNAAEGLRIADMCGCPYAGETAKPDGSEIYILAVADGAIAEVAGSLESGDAVVAHTAGSMPLDVLRGITENRAVCYPLQTFTKGRETELTDVPFLIEGDVKALEAVRRFAGLLSGNIIEVDSQRRAVLHAAAVFASNFTNYMYRAAEELTREAGFGFGILKPLILETAAKAANAGSPRATQTGPASRGDDMTMQRHRELLAGQPGLLKLYNEISALIWETSKKTSPK